MLTLDTMILHATPEDLDIMAHRLARMALDRMALDRMACCLFSMPQRTFMLGDTLGQSLVLCS